MSRRWLNRLVQANSTQVDIAVGHHTHSNHFHSILNISDWIYKKIPPNAGTIISSGPLELTQASLEAAPPRFQAASMA